MTKNENIEILSKTISAYMEANPSGGSLHIVLEDGNESKSNIEFCGRFAKEHNDAYGELIASELLKLNDKDRNFVLNNYYLI
jgi:hypothetical protein